jgi:hypothetical protein
MIEKELVELQVRHSCLFDFVLALTGTSFTFKFTNAKTESRTGGLSTTPHTESVTP